MEGFMTPLERRVVEYHVWKSQLYKASKPVGKGCYGRPFLDFKEHLGTAEARNFYRLVIAHWRGINLLDLSKALGEYEDDCPDLLNIAVSDDSEGKTSPAGHTYPN